MITESTAVKIRATQFPQEYVEAADRAGTTPRQQFAIEQFTNAEEVWINSQMIRVEPGSTPLAHAYSKLRMAQRSRAELNWILWAYFVDSRYKVVCKPNEAGTQHGLYVEFEVKPDFLLWGNKLAEFALHLLSALDQLWYSLQTCDGGGNVGIGERVPTDTKFPIFTVKDKVAGSKSKNFFFNCSGQPRSEIRNIDQQLWQVFEKIQPFNMHPDEPEKNPFEIIRKMSNIDKHREPLPIVLRPQFDYFFQTQNSGVSDNSLKWFGRDYRGQPDGKIGHFLTPPEVVIEVEENITLQPCIESVRHSTVDTFSHSPANVVGSEMLLPKTLEKAVTKLLQDIGNVMGWDENLIGRGIFPVDTTEEVPKRRWLPGVGPCEPFVVQGIGSPRRNW